MLYGSLRLNENLRLSFTRDVSSLSHGTNLYALALLVGLIFIYLGTVGSRK